LFAVTSLDEGGDDNLTVPVSAAINLPGATINCLKTSRGILSLWLFYTTNVVKVLDKAITNLNDALDLAVTQLFLGLSLSRKANLIRTREDFDAAFKAFKDGSALVASDDPLHWMICFSETAPPNPPNPRSRMGVFPLSLLL
jgi:hypothetical protein